MTIKILAIGKKHEPWVQSGIERYQKRLKRPFDVEWVLLPHSNYDADRARQEESGRILSRLTDRDFVVLLDERGNNITSPQLSHLLTTTFEAARPVTLIIGGAYGVDETVHDRADFIWSLSGLVFPHQLVRLMLIEQLYRAQEIASGNLKISVNKIPKDEVGELLVDVERMAHDLDHVQKKLLSTEKFSVIGELAARMAHDIRNPLMSIKIGVDYFRTKPNWGDKELNMFKITDDAIERISFQIQDVLDFIKVTPIAPEKTSLLALLKSVSDAQKIPEDIQLTLPENDYTIECDPRKMQVVFINTIRNAVDAVKPSGKISVRFIDSNDSIKIEIEDSGPGVLPENQSKVFEPLFTTKMRGTGLGLSSVKNIIEQHKGTITFSNNPTILSIILPKTQTT